MSTIILAVAPVFALIFVGYGLKRLNFPGEGFWPVSERLTYFVLFPALLIQGFTGKELSPELIPLSAAVICAVLAVAVATRLLWPLLGIDGPAYTSIFQGAIRPNTYIGLSIAAALLGPQWLTLSAMAMLSMIPVVNVLSVTTLSRHGIGNGGGLKSVVLQLGKNPLILSCAVGLAMNLLHLSLPQVLDDLLAILGRAALPMGLLAAGAGLRFERMNGGKRSLAAACALHLVVLPLAAILFSNLFGADESARLAAVIYTAIPVSVSSFILARQMGGDHRLMAQIITIQTLVSVVTIPLTLSLLQ